MSDRLTQHAALNWAMRKVDGSEHVRQRVYTCPHCKGELQPHTYADFRFYCAKCGWADPRPVTVTVWPTKPIELAQDDYCGMDPMKGKSELVVTGGELHLNWCDLLDGIAELGFDAVAMRHAVVTAETDDTGVTFRLTRKP